MITIIGGGVFGLSIGWYLAKAGKHVTILEQGQAGRGATWAAAGMLMPWKLSEAFSPDLFALQQEGYRRWPEFAQALMSATGLDLDYRTDGRYFLALMENAAQRLRRQYEFHAGLDFTVEWLSGDEARRREAYLGPKVLAAIFTPMAHHVDNRRLSQALRQAFLEAGGRLRENCPVSKILINGSRVRGLQLPDGVLSTEAVIAAAGAWSSRLPGLPDSLQGSVRPRKGQTLILQMTAARPLIKRPLIGPVYLVPRADGRLVVGTTVEREAGFDVQPTAGGIFHILRKARDMVPGIEELPLVELGAGLRPTGPNRLPILGPTETKGLSIATGGHSYGILLTPIVAKTMSQLLLTGQISEMIKPFLPN